VIDLRPGDCLEVLASMAPESIDACATDPPYHLASIVKRFGAEGAAPAKGNDAYERASRGFMGKVWDGGDIAFRPETWAAVLRVLKPGAHLVAFGAPKNYHRLACAIEDAGFEIRDSLMWLFGSGFPKSHDVSKGIDARVLHGGSNSARMKAANASRPGTGRERNTTNNNGIVGTEGRGRAPINDNPATEEAARWQGWGTALKPAYEPIILARKPLIGTVAQNVMKHGTGAINVDGCRIALDGGYKSKANGRPSQTGLGDNYDPTTANTADTLGRWPANIVHDGSDEVLAGFPPAEEGRSAARFFYCAKAGKADRAESKHPTVKPVALMRWLCRLITPPGGVILDPFAGSGTTGQAALDEGFSAILIEREAEYQADIRRRLGLTPSFEEMVA